VTTDTMELSRHGVESAPTAGPRRGRWTRSGSSPATVTALALGGYLVLQLAQLALLRTTAPRFFWLDDSQGQFGPMWWWLGQHKQDGRPPLMDPELGMAGNLAADMQYGVLDPLHWGLHALFGLTDDFLVMSWAFASISVLLLGAGTLLLLRHHGVSGWLSLAGALGVASSGFLLWYGSSWWPMLWSVAWLPWFWLGLVSLRWTGPLVLGVATWALLASGNPYVLFFALALVAAQAYEQIRDGGGVRVLLRPLGLARVAAAVGGLLLALPTLLTTVELSPYMSRLEPDAVVGNAAFGVPNLADVLLGGPTLLGQTNGFGGTLGLVPAMYTWVVAVAAVALVDWRRAIRSSGVVTAGAVLLLAVAFTQLPTVVAVFRYPYRYLVVVQVVLPLLVLLALKAAPHLTRRRLLVAGSLVLAQTALAAFRAPVFVKWHVLAGVLTALAVAALVVALSRRSGGGVRAVAAALVVLLSWGTVFIGEQMMESLQERVVALDGVAAPDDVPFRVLPAGRQLGTTVAAYEERSYATGTSATVITYGFDGDMGWSGGVLRGNGNLVSDLRTGTGSFAVWHAALNAHWCRTYEGATCDDPARLLELAPGTGRSWLDLASSDTVLLDRDAPQLLQDHFAAQWTLVEQGDAYTEYRREDGLPGRVTDAQGVAVSQSPGGSGMAYGSAPMDTYTVSTGSEDGSLVLRIPFWPGLRATLGGEPLPVDTVDGALLRVPVPSGVEGELLEIAYVPIGERLLVPSLGAGAVLVLAAAAWATVTGRRRDTVPAGVRSGDR
jgi:hypothetical protein